MEGVLIRATHKHGEKNDLQNHRPTSLLPVILKILEKIISSQLVDYLDDENHINDCQYAYRRRASTEAAPIKISELIYKATDDNCLLLIVYWTSLKQLILYTTITQ